jgi:hypothetical protein
MKLKMQFERVLALILITIGVLLMVFGIFQAFFFESELSVFGEPLREESPTEYRALGQNSLWFLTLFTELVGGFFSASIGIMIIKK